MTAGPAASAGESPAAPRVAVVILNWNGWRDTEPCLDSLFRSDYPDFRVVVCDNASTDGSAERLAAWGRARAAAGAMGVTHAAEARWPAAPGALDGSARPRSFLLLHTGANRGFAGGNNVGIAAALDDPTVAYVWLLNNDTTVAPDAMAELVRTAAAAGDAVLASAHVREMDRPDEAWFEGGEYSPWLATARHVSPDRFAAAECRYLSGCALLLSREAVQRIGALDDTMFMYAEDVEYSARARAAGVPLVVAPRSVVLHAGGASSGTGSAFSYRNHVANMVRAVTRHHGRARLVTIVPFHLAKAAYLFVARHRSPALLRAYLGGLVRGVRGP